MGKALIIKGANFSVNGIPAEFTKLAWLGGSTANNSYINSGIYWGNKVSAFDEELQFHFKLDATGLQTNNFYSIGTKINDWSNCCAWLKADGTSAYFGNVSVGMTGVILFDGAWHTLSINKNGCIIDGVSYPFATAPTAYSGTNPAPSAVYGNNPIYLDCSSMNSGTTKNKYIDGPSSAMKIAWAKYYRAGTCILDAIPVKRNDDNKICFYDRVTGEYLVRNDGSNPDYSAT